MNVDQARATVREALHQVAPDVDADTVQPDTRLREDLELDSLDFETFVVQLSERTGHRIDEDDYPELGSVGECVTYLVRHG